MRLQKRSFNIQIARRFLQKSWRNSVLKRILVGLLSFYRVSRVQISPKDLRRFKDKVKHSYGCWIWQGYRGKSGYGTFSVKHKNISAHRFSYMAFKGPIPEGMTIDHLCRKPSCVNPKHLEAVPIRENLLRSKNTQASKNLSKTHCKRGHPFSLDNVQLKNGHRICKECRKIYNRETYARRYSKKAQGGESCLVTIKKKIESL